MSEASGIAPVVIEARGLVKRFPGVTAVDRASLTLRRGRLLALLGENGAGKSTLMSMLAGVIRPDEGEIHLEGRVVVFTGPHQARMQGVATIFQELSVCQNLTVAENVFLGNEPRNAAGFIDFARMNRDAAELLRRMGLNVPPETPLQDLRVGQQQLVEIARALSVDARVIIMDEPTSALSGHEVAALLRIVAELKAAGVAIVYITHKLDELERIADDVLVMRDGRVVGEGGAETFTQPQLVSLMAGRESGAAARTDRKASVGREILRVNDATLAPERPGARPRLSDVSLHVCRGEVLGIFGLMGAGRTELLETLFGVHARQSRLYLSIDGVLRRFRGPGEAIQAGLALAPEDRKQAGLFLDMTAIDNATSASLKVTSVGGVLRLKQQRQRATREISQVGFRGRSDVPTRNLSGGNQQKVVLAKWLSTAAKVLLLDEPTRGIDVNARNEIYSLIDQHVRDGLAVIMASSDLPEIFALSDRIMVMREGRKSAEFARDAATPELVLAAALPLEARALEANA